MNDNMDGNITREEYGSVVVNKYEGDTDGKRDDNREDGGMDGDMDGG